MVDEVALIPYPHNNIRSLLTELSEELDDRFARFRRGTRYEAVRQSDVRVFMLVFRGIGAISALAETLKVSRQAAHKLCTSSIQALRRTAVVASASSSMRVKVAFASPSTAALSG